MSDHDQEYIITGANNDGSSFGGYTDQVFKNSGNCIIPSTMFNATPYDISYSGGFGGRPGVHTVKFVNPDGDYQISASDINLDIGMSVGITNFNREQVLTDFEIEQTVGSKILTCRFEDKRIIDLQRHLIVCRQIIKFGAFDSFLIGDSFASPCVSVYGTMYHKLPGAPNRLDNDTLGLGPSPLIYTGGNAKGNRGGAGSNGPQYMKISPEYVFYNSAWLGNDSKLDIGDGLRYLLKNPNRSELRFLSKTGNALDIIRSLAGECGWFLYANEKGQLDALNQLPKIPEDIANSIGNRCSIRSIKKHVSMKNTFDKGGWATWLHDDSFKADFDARFLSIDLLGLPISVCDPSDPYAEKSGDQAAAEENPNAGNKDGGDEVNVVKDSTFVSMYEPRMSKAYVAQLKRLLKMAVLDTIWQNWNGMSTYIHLKRLRENTVSGTIPTFSAQGIKDQNGKNIKTGCARTGAIPVKGGDKGKIETNAAVNKLFPCIKPALLDYPSAQMEDAFNKAVMNDGANNNIEIKPPLGGGRQILVLDTGMSLQCQSEKLGRKQPKPQGPHALQGQVQGGKWDGGAAADRAELLSTLALSVGQYWILTGPGNGGGGGGLMTERQHSYRTYHQPNGQIIWYDKRISVRYTVFKGIYERVYGDRLKEWDLQGGIKRPKTQDELEADEELREAGKEDEIVDTFDKVGDLSVSQFLQLAYRLKYEALGGDKGKASDPKDITDLEELAFKGGNGKTSEEIESLNLSAKERCARGEPKGIVIWDAGVNQPELPLQNAWMASIGGGLQAKVDKTGSDVVRWSMQQVTMAVVMNPMKHLRNVVTDRAGNTTERADKPDSLDGSLDNIILHQDLERIGENRIKKIPFEAERARHFWRQSWMLPQCGSQAYKFQFEHKSMDGKILWRTLDCYGNTEPWKSETDGFNLSSSRNNASIGGFLERTVNDMLDEELDPESSYSYTTCGETVPILPSVEQGLQAYTVSLAKDGSVITTFEVSRAAIRAGKAFTSSYSNSAQLTINRRMSEESGMHIDFMTTSDDMNIDSHSFNMGQNNLQSGTKLHNGQFLF